MFLDNGILDNINKTDLNIPLCSAILNNKVNNLSFLINVFGLSNIDIVKLIICAIKNCSFDCFKFLLDLKIDFNEAHYKVLSRLLNLTLNFANENYELMLDYFLNNIKLEDDVIIKACYVIYNEPFNSMNNQERLTFKLISLLQDSTFSDLNLFRFLNDFSDFKLYLVQTKLSYISQNF